MKTARFNINNLIRENVKQLKPYSTARDEFKDFYKEMIFLDANENPFDNGANRYPDPQQKKVKEVLAQRKGLEVQNILLGNGSDEVLDLIFRAFCEPKVDNVVTLPPTYGMYGVLADINVIENREVLLTENFQPDMDKVLSTIDEQTKIVFICSPNNPSGNAFEIEPVLKLLNSFNGLVVIDEAYIDFSSQESWLTKLDDYPNLIVTQTLSKAYGLAGIRLGICYASKEIIAVLNKIKPPYNINDLTQERALLRLLKRDKVQREIDAILDEREKLLEALTEVSFIKKIYPTDANFVLVKVDDANKRYKELLEQGIVVRNRTTQPLCKNTLRLTVGTNVENQKLIRVLLSISEN